VAHHGWSPPETNFDEFDCFWITDAPFRVLAEEPGIKGSLQAGIAPRGRVVALPVDNRRLIVPSEEHEVDLPGDVCAVVGDWDRELREVFGSALNVFEQIGHLGKVDERRFNPVDCPFDLLLSCPVWPLMKRQCAIVIARLGF